MVQTRRPGMEVVIAAHKSVAELGVIGRAEEMHAIMDAERDATLAYLDSVTRQMGAGGAKRPRPRPRPGSSTPIPATPPPGRATPPPTTIY